MNLLPAPVIIKKELGRRIQPWSQVLKTKTCVVA